MKIQEIAQLIKGEIKGVDDLDIKRISDPDESSEGSLIFLFDKAYRSKILESKASVIVTFEWLPVDTTQILVSNPRMALTQLATLFSRRSTQPISGPVSIDNSVTLPSCIELGSFVVIGKGVTVGKNCVFHSGVVIGNDCVIGDNVVLYPHVTLYDSVRIGNEVIIHSNSVIGADGFGYESKEDGEHVAVPQIGSVRIEDRVHIGASSSVDRGAIRDTVIGEGSKLDNQVQIAHNCRIGKHCILVAQVGVAGSMTVGDHCIIAGQSGLIASIGNHVTVGSKSAVTRTIPDGQFVSGIPARPHQDRIKEAAILKQIVRSYSKK